MKSDDLAARLSQTCRHDGCDSTAVLDGWCFIHLPDAAPADGTGGELPAELVDQLDNEPAFDEVVSMGLAALILDATADCMTDHPLATTEAINQLCEDTLLPADSAAGILIATSALLAGSDMNEAAVREAAARYRDHAETEEGEPV